MALILSVRPARKPESTMHALHVSAGVVHPEASDQIAELPTHLLPHHAQAVAARAAAPWSGTSHDANNPEAEVRRWLFGPLGVGQVLHLVLEREREVHVLRVVRLEPPDD